MEVLKLGLCMFSDKQGYSSLANDDYVHCNPRFIIYQVYQEDVHNVQNTL
jgi:hypothetical protein